MSIARDLFQLQEIDLALEANSQAQARITAQLGESQVVLDARKKLADAQKKLEDLTKEQKSTEWEIEDLTGKIKATDKKLYGGKISSSKELSNLQLEMDDLKKRRSGFEDKALGLMDDVESTRQAVATDTDELVKLEARWNEQHRHLATELEQLKAKRPELQANHDKLAALIEKQALAVYQELRKRKGTAVAKIERGICQGCRIVLSQSELQQAKGGGLVRCGSCGRVIFLA